jgi:predicted PurR-regulated permease PerM
MGVFPEQPRIQRWTFLVLFAFSAYLFWRTAEPLWVPIFLGLLIAVGTYPVHKRLVARLRGRASLSALALTAAVLLASLATVGLVLAIVSSQLVSLGRAANEHFRHGGAAELLGPRLNALLVRLHVDSGTILQVIGQAAEAAAGNVAHATGTILAASVGSLLALIFAALTSFYLLREGAEITAWFVRVLPLPDGQVWELVRNFRDVTRAMLLGTGATALYQGLISFVGYWVLGLPSPLLFASLTAVASLLPGIGTALIWVPLAGWLLASDAIGRGLVLLVWGSVLIVGIADYLLRPKLLGNRVKMNELLVLIALFGGIEAFGLLGLILGPIVVALFVALVRIYEREYRPPV